MKKRILTTTVCAFVYIAVVFLFDITGKLFRFFNVSVQDKNYALEILLLPLIIHIPAILILWYIFLRNPYAKRKKRLLLHGKKANAIIVKIEDTGVTVNKNPCVRFYLRVQPEYGSEYETVLESVVSRIAIPRVGDVITVLYDPDDVKQVVIV